MSTYNSYPGGTVKPILTDAPQGMLAQLTVEVRGPLPADTELLAAAAYGMTETTRTDGKSNYQPTLTLASDADAGEYEIRWLQDGTLVSTDQLFLRAVTSLSGDMVPTAGDVALKVLARTRDKSGNLGVFGPNTNPTGEQVGGMIQALLRRVRARLGAGFDATRVVGTDDAGNDITLGDMLRDAVAAGVAAQVELSLEPESASSADSAYTQLRQEYEDGLQILIDSTTTDPADVQGFGAALVASPTATGYEWQLNDPTWPPANATNT